MERQGDNGAHRLRSIVLGLNNPRGVAVLSMPCPPACNGKRSNEMPIGGCPLRASKVNEEVTDLRIKNGQLRRVVCFGSRASNRLLQAIKVPTTQD